ncbi:unnamed protein product, partial [Prorocentrum cordatum]
MAAVAAEASSMDDDPGLTQAAAALQLAGVGTPPGLAPNAAAGAAGAAPAVVGRDPGVAGRDVSVDAFVQLVEVELMKNFDVIHAQAQRPTVEGAVLAAARRAWGEDPALAVAARGARTERGLHAAENVLVLTASARPGRRDAGLAPGGAGHAARGARRLRAGPRGGPSGCQGLWLGPVRGGATRADLVALLAGVGVRLAEADVELEAGKGQAVLRMPAASAVRAARELHGTEFMAQRVAAMPAAEAHAKLRVQKRVRLALKAIRGGQWGLRSFHNFVEGGRPGAPHALRRLQCCTNRSFTEDLRRPARQVDAGPGSAASSRSPTSPSVR